MICQSCGGVVGRDCYNPEECMWITQRMAAEYQAQQQEQYYAEREYEKFEGRAIQEYYEKLHQEHLLEQGFDPISLGM